MNIKQTKYELQNLLSGKSGASYDSLIQTVANHIESGKRASPMAPEKHQNKKQEAENLIQFAKNNNLIYEDVDDSKFISSGAEQSVYIKDNQNVIKLDDAIVMAPASTSVPLGTFQTKLQCPA